jgi:hypothetical protein
MPKQLSPTPIHARADTCVQRTTIAPYVSDDARSGRVNVSPSHVFRGAGQCQLKDWPSVTQFRTARLLYLCPVVVTRMQHRVTFMTRRELLMNDRYVVTFKRQIRALVRLDKKCPASTGAWSREWNFKCHCHSYRCPRISFSVGRNVIFLILLSDILNH